MDQSILYNVPHHEAMGAMIVIYFFLSGLGAGAFLTAACLRLFGGPEYAKIEKTAAIAKIDAAIVLESEAAYNLEQMDGKNLHKAMMRILQAVSRETHIKGEIEKSIASLQEAVDILQASVEN